MIAAALNFLRRFHAAIRHDDLVDAAEDGAEKMPLPQIDMRDDYEQVEAGAYLESVEGMKP